MSARIDLIAGARPNFMKIASIVRELDRRAAEGGILSYRLVHTGQHYDANMSGSFFEQLGIPEPQVNLEVGSGTQATQTAAVMTRYEALLMESPSELCLVVGDVNSTMACSIAARKLGVPVAHVEAGIRSGDWGMPEEINRVVTDSITNWFYTTSETANEQLRRNGVDDDAIVFVGNTMIDTLLANRHRFEPPAFLAEHGLARGDYYVATLHRPSNVDGEQHLLAMLRAMASAADGRKIVFPVHPRTAATLARIGLDEPNILTVEPQPYLQFNYLVEHARGVITDSGGITEETTVMDVPCLTLRTSTERPETITIGTNELIGTDPEALHAALARIEAGERKAGGIPPLWDGRAGERIVAHLERVLTADPG